MKNNNNITLAVADIIELHMVEVHMVEVHTVEVHMVEVRTPEVGLEALVPCLGQVRSELRRLLLLKR